MMKKMCASIALVACIVFFATLSAKAGEGWTTDYKKAVEQAKAEKKLVLLDFTGSDWCEWCKKLDAEVFSTDKFKNYASGHFVLLTVDFPQAKPQTNEVRDQNEQLREKYNVEEFPTLLIMNGKGEVVGKINYIPGAGLGLFLAKLDKVRRLNALAGH